MTLDQKIESLRGVRGEFAASLIHQYNRKGTLSEKQLYWVDKLLSDAANACGIKVPDDYFDELYPVRRIATIMASGEELLIKAPRNGKQVLYVSIDGDYRGKIDADGGYIRCDCVPQKEHVKEALDEMYFNAEEVAREYGIETGTCCVCGATLTDPDSKEAGIGPICALRF